MSQNLEQQATDALARCKSEARKDGMFAGVTSGLTGGLIGAKFFKFGRYTTLFCTLLTGGLSGYFFTDAFTESNLARLRDQETQMRKERAVLAAEASLLRKATGIP